MYVKSTFHKVLLLLLILPVTLWAFTGAFFLIKPGYKDAYEQLQITRYSLPSILQLSSEPEWQAIAVNQTILGNHYRVQIDNKT